MGGAVSYSNLPKTTTDIQLEEAKDAERYKHKILLLGAGECGKSTVVKQIKMVWKVGGGPSEREKMDCILPLRRNCIESIQTILGASKKLNIPLENAELAADFDIINNLDSSETLTPDIASKIVSLWRDGGIIATYAKRDLYWNLDATPYYMAEVMRIADDDFTPTEEDMVMTRVRTTGIVVTTVNEPPFTYQIVDVGGQRSERRKWIHCFDDVKAIIFLEGLSGYNQVLYEDNTVNRMQESLLLFEEIMKNPLFQSTPIFVFLNKKDLFEEMIPKCPLSSCFPEYTGPPGQVQPALQFIEDKYREIALKHNPNKHIFVFVIAARVRMDMKIAFGEVKEQLKKIYPVKKK